MSDTKPIQRTPQERVRLLRELEETLKGMRSHTSADLRRSLEARIAELRVQIQRDGQVKSAPAEVKRPDVVTNGRRREVSAEEEARRSRRSPRAAHAF